MSLFRRAGALIARFFTSAADPAAAAGELQLYAKDDGGVSQLFARSDDGTISQLTPIAPTPADSIVIIAAALGAGPFDLTALGPIDWLYTRNLPYAGASTVSGLGPGLNGPQGTGWYRKQMGGWLADSFRLHYGGNAALSSSAATGGVVNQAANSDTMNQAQVSAAPQVSIYLADLAGVTGYGYSFRVPAPKGMARTLTVRTGTQSNCTSTLSAMFSHQTVPTTITDVVIVNGAREWTVTYTSSQDSELTFHTQVTATSGNAQTTFQSATLS